MSLHDWFLLPLVNGLLTTILLTLAGVGLLLRGSVWQVFAVSQWAAVGGVAASVLAIPVLWPALVLAALALAIQRRWHDAERLSLTLFLAGLAVITLLAANISQASLAAARWVDGQLYFTGVRELVRVTALVALSVIVLPMLRRVWLWAQRQPDISAQPGLAWYWRSLELGWLVLVIVVGAQALGVPGAMATLLLPAWAAARVAKNLTHLLVWSQLLAFLAFVCAWVVSLWLDQPFAPVLVLLQLGLMGVLVGGQKLRMRSC
ncbi:metal ABC transporter permease [Halopseudomonas salegens]|uniref:Zinc/manganese transport system permease protein n=1 Tax=Halopseudomonas salegens TaxID=1434072 RepID=A0A1H2FFF8_9GAMM|nr:metal ABC transporter permease [Halopseudomonas salegens]SDU06019.1 zinc/manganese transport system permease protein [Halopseudomonas salegens]